eukprot:1176776-Prorocentrum_minimum.AAC.3
MAGVDVTGIQVDVIGIGVGVIGIRLDVIGSGVDVIGKRAAMGMRRVFINKYIRVLLKYFIGRSKGEQ